MELLFFDVRHMNDFKIFQRNIVPARILRVSHWALGWSQNLLRCLLKRIDTVELICSLDLQFCA